MIFMSMAKYKIAKNAASIATFTDKISMTVNQYEQMVLNKADEATKGFKMLIPLILSMYD